MNKFNKKMKNLINNNDGFSFVESMVGAFAIAASFLIFLAFAAGLYRDIKVIEGKAAVNTTAQILQNYLSSINVCTLSVDRVTVVGIPANTAGPTNPDPGDFNIMFDIKSLGQLKNGLVNDALGLYIDRLYVTESQFAEKNALGLHRYVGMLKLDATQKIQDEGGVRRGLSYKEKVIGSISVTFSDQNKVVDCTMDARVLEPPPPTGCVVGCSEPPVIIDPDTGGIVSTDLNPTTPPTTCTSIEQCAVYDYFIRNGIPNPFQSADAWMDSNSSWFGIAGSYISQMSSLQQMNLISNSYGNGLVQTGLNGANTVDAWVQMAVSRDPAGISMLRAQSGLETLASMFPSTPGDVVVGGTLFTTKSQEMLKDILISNPEVTMNSALGIGVWTQAIGASSVADFYGNYPGAAILGAANPNSVQDAAQIAAINQIKSYVASNPTDGMAVALGAGIWANYLPGGATAVSQFIAQSFSNTGDMSMSMDLARATSLWATSYSGGVQAVGDFIAAHAADAAAIASGTVIATDIFGGAAVAQAIMADPSASSQIALDLAAFQTQSGWTTQQMTDYVSANASTWQADLTAAVRP